MGYRFINYDLSTCRACPCGGRPELIMDFVNDYEVRCTKCHDSTWAYMDLEDAIEDWQNGNTMGKLDLVIDDVQSALSGEIEYILFANDDDFWMANRQSCDCNSIVIKFKNKPEYYFVEAYDGYLDIDICSSFNESIYNKKLTPPEDIGVSLLSVHFDNRMPTELNSTMVTDIFLSLRKKMDGLLFV